MNKGFTLIELSIVLVIMGLLTAGILVAQSLIDSAKINRLVSFITQIDIAQTQFQNQFRCLPGDCSRSFTPNGDGNGFVEGYAANGSDRNVRPENRAFWKHLSEGGFKPDGVIYSDAYTHASQIELGVHSPKTPAFNDVSVFVTYDPIWGTEPHFSNNSYDISRIGNTGQDGFLTPLMAISFDTKIDDTNPLTGISVIAAGRSSTTNGCALDPANVSPYALNMTSKEEACILYIGFGFTIKDYNLVEDLRIISLGHTP